MSKNSVLRTLYCLGFILLILSCAKNEKTVTAKDILVNTIDASGGDYFNNSTVSFNMADLDYKLFRKDNIAEFEVTRQLDTLNYKAVYKNGYSAYFVNDSLQEENYYSRKFIESKLEGLTYIFSIPFNLNQNATQLTRLEDVIIDDKLHYALHVTFTEIEGQPSDEFILYINQATNLMDYYIQIFHLTGGTPLFKKAINRRSVNSIQFSDFWAFKIDDTSNLKSAYKNYNRRNLKAHKKIEFENINVVLNE